MHIVSTKKTICFHNIIHSLLKFKGGLNCAALNGGVIASFITEGNIYYLNIFLVIPLVR